MRISAITLSTPCPRLSRALARLHPSVSLDGHEGVEIATEEALFELPRIRGPIGLRFVGSGSALARLVRRSLLHLQRLLPRRNDDGALEVVLARHRQLHDTSKPLVAADLDHALDTWQWTLRLAPQASLGLQIAALFHDVERLESEADVRVEHHATDYQAFKDAHARQGAARVRAILAGCMDEAVLDHAAGLVERHERVDDDPARTLLNEADALSFFSINACGFLRYFGEAHTRRKLAWSYARLGPRGLRWLGQVPMRADLARLLAEVT